MVVLTEQKRVSKSKYANMILNVLDIWIIIEKCLQYCSIKMQVLWLQLIIGIEIKYWNRNTWKLFSSAYITNLSKFYFVYFLLVLLLLWMPNNVEILRDSISEIENPKSKKQEIVQSKILKSIDIVSKMLQITGYLS